MIDFDSKFTNVRLEELAQALIAMSETIGFKVSSRGWCYLLENNRYINKNHFSKAENAINKCRRKGLLPVDFVAEEDARRFACVEEKSGLTIKETLKWMLEDVLDGSRYHTPDWWDGESYYIQMVVEKIDLKTLFEPVCAEYHVPIANAKGWSSILQRAEYARRFKQAEDKGLKCVLLYCGDHDPDGLRISDAIRKNLEQIRDARWADGCDGYDPRYLDIVRFGLNFDFIQKNNYTWIDNLITGSGENLAKPDHRNFKFPYVQSYLAEIGERKCEANAVVTTPDEARTLCRATIENILGADALDRFAEKRKVIRDRYEELLSNSGVEGPIRSLLDDDEGG